MNYKASGTIVTESGAVEYECETEEEAIAVAQAANSFFISKGRDHKSWDELVQYMNWNIEKPIWW